MRRELYSSLAREKCVGWVKMELPSSIQVRPEERNEAYKKVLSFVADFVNQRTGVSKFNFEVKVIEELESGRGGLESIPRLNYIHTLYFDGRMAGTVFETKDRDNYIHFDYYINQKVD